MTWLWPGCDLVVALVGMPGLRVWDGVEWVVDKALGGEYSPGEGMSFMGR